MVSLRGQKSCAYAAATKLAKVIDELGAKPNLSIPAATSYNMIVIGPPGSGKTVLAKADAGDLATEERV